MTTTPRWAKRARRATVTAVLLAGLALTGLPPASAAPSPEAAQQYRPLTHFSPKENWMNDPNGLVYYKGVYHLYYQHNPKGTRWGNMSWGHATSKDLIHWEEQPLAIPQTFNADGVAIEDIFSGSVVVDKDNSSGFGTADNPPLVAIYTSAYTGAHPTYAGLQAQSLAYSVDDGQTWTKYTGNPVLNRSSGNHRDPKVFWYETPGGGGYWVMVTVEATEHRVLLYKSEDLKSWDYLSDFGPANSTAGIWECPDLFPLKVEGTDETKWVMIVNLNPGAVAGGSGGQYFVGDFDGKTFTSESTVATDGLPPGTTFAGFDDGTYNGWTVNNEPGNRFNGPWTDAPASGAMEGQSPVTGFSGAGLINGFADADWPMGTIESPTFTVKDSYLNFLVGGGNHPHVAGSQNGNEAPAGELLFDGFEYPGSESVTEHGWTLTGDFEPARNPATSGGEFYLGDKRINTYDGGPKGDDNTGTLTSSEFTIDDDYLSFLVGGGRRTDGSLAVQLLVGDEVVRTVSGDENGRLNWKNFDVSDLRGQTARLRINDQATGGWGHLTFDHPVLGPKPAQVRSEETSVNLVVDGKVVRTATGSDAESLDWASWDLRPYEGQQATITVVDQNRWGWGHVLADQFMFSDQAAPSRLESYDWLDWGRDYYATVTFGNVPDGKRISIGWMNNWQYGEAIPTSTWRSSMTLPRELGLVETANGPRLIQHAVDQVSSLYKAPSLTLGAQPVSGTSDLAVDGDVVQVDATFTPGTADKFGLSVFGKGDSKTLIGYDTDSRRLYVDRRNSGNVDFHPAFSSIEDAPVALQDGKLKLRLFLDRASVEVFAQDGRTTITDQVFPLEGADDLGLFAEGGEAQLESLQVTPLWSILDDSGPTVTCDVAAPGPQLAAGSSAQVTASVSDTESGPAETSVSAPADTTSLGAKTVSLTGADRSGNTTTITCPYTVVAGAPATIAAVSGSGQSTAAGSAFAQPLRVKVTDAQGNPVAGTTVTFSAPRTGASGAFLGGSTAVTDASGVAAVSVTANAKVGSWKAGAKVAGVGSGVSFTLINKAPPAKKADLGIELKGPSSLKKGQSGTFTITVSNLGPDTAGSVITTAALPSKGLKITKVSGSSTQVGGLVVWSKVATMSKGQSQTYTVTATATAKGTWSTTAGTGSVGTGDPKPSNNIAVRSVTVK